MSSDSNRRKIESLNRDIGQLHTRLASERKKEADKLKRIGSIERSITKNTSVSSLQSKSREVSRHNKDLERLKKNQADISKKIADKEKKKSAEEQALMKAQNKEQVTFQKQQKRELAEYKEALYNELENSTTARGTEVNQTAKPHDVFISHASEDKEAFVRSLAEALSAEGVDVWYDETVLTIGDSLRRSIDKGLASSRFGIVVLSTSFFAKNWPQYELDGLVTKETSSGKKVILPIWHKVSKDEVAGYSPTLADKVALNTGVLSLADIVRQLVDVIQPVSKPEEPEAGSD